MVQMPAVNTPRFDWVRSRLPERAQPVPPIHQPEVAARAVVFAADHPGRREYRVGGSTVATLIANAIAPAVLDRYLARTGLASQQTAEPRPVGESDNLFSPADAGQDHGTHGRFDDRARGLCVLQQLAQRLTVLEEQAHRTAERLTGRWRPALSGFVSGLRGGHRHEAGPGVPPAGDRGAGRVSSVERT